MGKDRRAKEACFPVVRVDREGEVSRLVVAVSRHLLVLPSNQNWTTSALSLSLSLA